MKQVQLLKRELVRVTIVASPVMFRIRMPIFLNQSNRLPKTLKSTKVILMPQLLNMEKSGILLTMLESNESLTTGKEKLMTFLTKETF